MSYFIAVVVDDVLSSTITSADYTFYHNLTRGSYRILSWGGGETRPGFNMRGVL